MKKSAIAIAMLSLWMAFAACEQQESLKAVSQLETLKTTFKKAEPAEFSFKTDAPAEQVKWSVSPNRNVQISVKGYTAKIHFGEAGRYFVTATNKTITSRTAVTVDTTTYVPGDTSTVTPPDEPVINPPVPTDTTTIKPPVDTAGTNSVYVALTGDEFVLTPSTIDTLRNGITIQFASLKSYECLNSYLSYEIIPGYQKENKNNILKLKLSHVIQPGSRFCKEGEKELLMPTHVIVPDSGPGEIEIELNGTVYQGSITKIGNTYNIDWPYNNGITFTKLTLAK